MKIYKINFKYRDIQKHPKLWNWGGGNEERYKTMFINLAIVAKNQISDFSHY